MTVLTDEMTAYQLDVVVYGGELDAAAFEISDP
jgi:hypothetical protein